MVDDLEGQVRSEAGARSGAREQDGAATGDMHTPLLSPRSPRSAPSSQQHCFHETNIGLCAPPVLGGARTWQACLDIVIF